MLKKNSSIGLKWLYPSFIFLGLALIYYLCTDYIYKKWDI